MKAKPSRPPLSHPRKLAIGGAFVLLWLGFMAWVLAWPPTWGSLPIWACLGFVAFRLFFELTINRARIPTLATCYVTRRKMADLLKREVARARKETYTIIDCGSGRGELARRIAKSIPSANVLGVELALFPYQQASWIQRLFGPKNLSYERSDFWSYDCAKADAVVLFLQPLAAQRMGEKLRRELKPGSVILSNDFPLLGDWTPEEVLTLRSPFKETLYIYRQR